MGDNVPNENIDFLDWVLAGNAWVQAMAINPSMTVKINKFDG